MHCRFLTPLPQIQSSLTNSIFQSIMSSPSKTHVKNHWTQRALIKFISLLVSLAPFYLIPSVLSSPLLFH
jgi:hypothetical protein